MQLMVRIVGTAPLLSPVQIIHGSDEEKSAAHEIGFWFKEDEIDNWAPVQAAWIYE
jgi:hypothetical protein